MNHCFSSVFPARVCEAQSLLSAHSLYAIGVSLRQVAVCAYFVLNPKYLLSLIHTQTGSALTKALRIQTTHSGEVSHKPQTQGLR